MDHGNLLSRYSLQTSIKAYQGYKAQAPEQTIQTIEDLFAKIGLKVQCGPVPHRVLARYTPFQTYSAELLPGDRDRPLLMRSSGKGITPTLARASATAELIERFIGHGLAAGLPRRYLSRLKMSEIWSHRAGQNDRCLNRFPFRSIGTSDIAGDRHKELREHNACSVCYSLTKKKLYSFPEELVVKLDGSTGLASGNTIEEAIQQALLERVERLSGAYFLDNLPECNALSVGDADHPALRRLIREVREAGFVFELLDFSFLFGIPVIICIFDHPEWTDPPGDRITKSARSYPITVIGVHTDPQLAAIRCFTEFIQTAQPIPIASAIECHEAQRFSIAGLDIPAETLDGLSAPGVLFVNGNQPRSIDLRSYLKKKRRTKPLASIKTLFHLDYLVEIERLVSLLESRGIEVLVRDLTSEAMPFPVVRVMLDGGAECFPKTPMSGLGYLIVGTDNTEKRYSLLTRIIDEVVSGTEWYWILRKLDWNSEGHRTVLIRRLMSHLCAYGGSEPFLGASIDSFHLLSLLYLSLDSYDKALDCIDAAFYGGGHTLSMILARALILKKKGMSAELEEMMEYAALNYGRDVDVHKALAVLELRPLDPRLFEIYDFRCDKKNNPKLCKSCFFGYADEKIFTAE